MTATCPPDAVTDATNPKSKEAAPSTDTTVPRTKPPCGSNAPIPSGTGRTPALCARFTTGMSRSATLSKAAALVPETPATETLGPENDVSPREGMDAICRRSCASRS